MTKAIARKLFRAAAKLDHEEVKKQIASRLRELVRMSARDAFELKSALKNWQDGDLEQCFYDLTSAYESLDMIGWEDQAEEAQALSYMVEMVQL